MICKLQTLGKYKDGRMFFHPCGQCLACRINDTRSWFVRTHFECKYTDRFFQYFLTLTYDEANIPDDKLCKKRHLKNFLNNLNTTYGLSLRYFSTSDYGNVGSRPHYHAILLSKKRISLRMCERIWKKGFAYLKGLNKANMKYVLRYTVKKTPFDGSLDGWFRLISKGWGRAFIDHYNGQEHLIIDGKEYSIPMYYIDKIEKLNAQKNPVDSSLYYDRLWLEHRDVVGTTNDALDDLRKLHLERRKYVENC
uniref:Replication initiator protein n=1 Tax=Dulem virus 76 TaxID=3145787 RepID=A0AAU8B7H3_9VIRU